MLLLCLTMTLSTGCGPAADNRIDEHEYESAQKRMQEAMRTIAESHVRQVSVDVAQLSDAEHAEHDRRLLRSSYLMHGIASANKEARAALRRLAERGRLPDAP